MSFVLILISDDHLLPHLFDFPTENGGSMGLGEKNIYHWSGKSRQAYKVKRGKKNC